MSYAGTDPVPGTGLPNEITQGASLPPVKPTMPAPDASQASVAMARGQTPTDFGAYGSPKFAGSPISPSTVGDPFSLMVNAIAGQRMPPAIPAIPPAEFARQAAAMEAAKAAQPAAPLPTPGAAISPADFARAAATMEAMKSGGSPPPAATSVTPPVTPAAVAPSPVPMPQPRPSMPLPTGSAIPGAVGPTSVNGAPLVAPGTIAGQPPLALPPPFGATSVNGAQLPQSGSPPGTPSPAQMVSAIAGGATTAPGALNPAAPIRVAQNGMPTAAAPAASGAPSPLIPPHPAFEQLRAVIADPRTSPELKALAVQQYQSLLQPQTLKVPGGTVQVIPGTGQHQFIPEEVPIKIKSGSQEVDGRAVYDPATGRYHVQTLLPDENTEGGAKAGEPNLSTIGGMQAAEAAQAGAKAAAEQRGKAFSAIHVALGGDALNSSRQEPILGAMTRIAPAAFVGAGADTMQALSRIASQLGINPEGAAPRELFNQLSAKLLGDQFANLRNMAAEEGSPGGKVFKSMLELEEKANITPEDSLPGVQAKLAFMQKAGQMLQKWGDMADDYAAAHNGNIDEGFMKSLRHDMASQKFDDILPQADATSPTGMKTTTTPPLSDIEAEMRRRGKLPPAGTPAAPVSQ